MKNISYDVFNELERICGQFASLIDPCQICDCRLNSSECEDCERSKEYFNEKQEIEEYIPEEIKEIYRELKDIGWVEKKVEEKQAVLHIIALKKIQEISNRKAEEILKENGFTIEEE